MFFELEAIQVLRVELFLSEVREMVDFHLDVLVHSVVLHYSVIILAESFEPVIQITLCLV
jgi:hypothetical protein